MKFDFQIPKKILNEPPRPPVKFAIDPGPEGIVTEVTAKLPDKPKWMWEPRRVAHNKREQYLKLLQDMWEKGPEAYTATMRLLCQYDLFFLCREVLGYKDLIEPLHDDMCDFMEKADQYQKSSLTLIPRAHFKSTICTVGRIIQWTLRDRDTAVGLFSGNLKQARKFAVEIKTHLETNDKIRRLFPEVLYLNPARESNKWTQDEFTVRRTKQGAVKKEGTVKIFGLLQAIPTGDHYNRLLGDDIVDQDIVGSEDQMLKVEDQLQYLTPLQMTPDDPIHLVGTRYHILDAYGKIIKDPNYMTYLRQCREDGKPIFPERFTLEMLERTRVKMGNYKFYCQYDMNPQDPADKKFKLKWLRSYKHWGSRPINQPYFNFFMVVDPANKQKKDSDFTAMLVLAVDHDMNVYFVDCIHDKLNPKERIDAVFELNKKWKPILVGYETIAFQDTDKFWIEQQQLKRSIYFPIEEIGHRKQNKFDYILSAQPLFQDGRFFLPTTPIYYERKWENPDDGFAQVVDVVELFRKQYDLFPNLAFDDLLDCMAMGVRIIEQGAVPRPAKPLPTEQARAYPKVEKEKFNPLAH